MSTHIRVDDSLHQKMKELSKKKKNNIKDEYERAIKEYIKNETQKEVLADSHIETLINKKMDYIDRHLSSFLGKIDKQLSLLYTTDAITLHKVLNVYSDKDIKYNDLMDYLEDKSEDTYKRLILKYRENKKVNE